MRRDLDARDTHRAHIAWLASAPAAIDTGALLGVAIRAAQIRIGEAGARDRLHVLVGGTAAAPAVVVAPRHGVGMAAVVDAPWQELLAQCVTGEDYHALLALQRAAFDGELAVDAIARRRRVRRMLTSVARTPTTEEA